MSLGLFSSGQGRLESFGTKHRATNRRERVPRRAESSKMYRARSPRNCFADLLFSSFVLICKRNAIHISVLLSPHSRGDFFLPARCSLIIARPCSTPAQWKRIATISRGTFVFVTLYRFPQCVTCSRIVLAIVSCARVCDIRSPVR